MDCNNYNIIIILLIVIIIYLLLSGNHNNIENYTEENLEAIQTLTSMYEKGVLDVTDLNVSRNFNMLPKGSIIAFNGKEIPKGWALCNGTNGTPNLSGRFIVGTKSNMSDFGNTAGSPNHTHEAGTLGAYITPTWTSSLGNRMVLEQNEKTKFKPTIMFSIAGFDTKNNVPPSMRNSEQLSSNVGGTTSSASSLPPCMALCYIMKL